MSQYVAVDLGATHLRAAVGDGAGTVLGRSDRKTPQGPDGAAVTDAVLTAVDAACEAAGVAPVDVAAGAVASVGPLDREAGAVLNPANLPDGVGSVPLTGPLSDHLEAPVSLLNDATAGVHAERVHADNPPENLVYLTISTGIGAGACVDGHVLDGRDGNAGEVGHVPLDPDGAMPCGCGASGHWEAYCSGPAIPAYARHLHDGESTALPLSESGFEAADVVAAAGSDPLADRVLDRVADWNARGVATLVATYAPAVVSVGGAVATNNPEAVVDPIRDRLPEMVPWTVPEIRSTPLGGDAVLRGALAAAVTAADANAADGGE